jgi:predicted metalloendopeptidase
MRNNGTIKKDNKMGTKTKRNHSKKNIKKYDILSTLSSKENECKEYLEPFKPFESEITEIFKKNKIDLSTASKLLETELITSLKKAVDDKSIAPNEDFYSYVNERWLKDYKVNKSQSYIVQVDNFRLVQDKVYRELIDIVDEFLSKNKTGALRKSLGDYYESCKKHNTIQQSKYYSKFMLDKINELRKDKANLWNLLGILNYNEIVSYGCPFVWNLSPDDKNPTIYRCYIDSPKLSITDINVYFDDGKDVSYKKTQKNTFLKYVDNVFTEAFGKDHGFEPNDVFECELKILNAMGCFIIKNGDINNYNIVKSSESKKLLGFDWTAFAYALGFKEVPAFFITSNINYILCMSQLLLKEWDSEKWRTYWIFIYIRQVWRFNIKGRSVFHEYAGKFIGGQEQPVDLKIDPIYTVGFAFNAFLTNEYIAKYASIQNINYVKTLAEDLKTVFIRILKENSWLDPKTRLKAIKKLEGLKLTVGSPPILRDDPLLDYSSHDLWGNLTKMSIWRHDKAVLLEGNKLIDMPVLDWSVIPPKFISTQAYVVNAAYTPSENGIYVPLGYIQKPFVDLEQRGVEYNLAHIGFTLAHEMSHALDDWGSKYDETGKLNDWWTEKDKKKFKAIQDDVIKQYEYFAKRDGINFDATASIGEDLADISGLSICREYLRDFQFKNEDILPIQSLSFEVFFVYFAFQQRQQLSKKSLESQLKTNPHPPDKYRTNIPLSRLEIFRAMFNVKKKDKMWWHSTNSVWSN